MNRNGSVLLVGNDPEVLATLVGALESIHATLVVINDDLDRAVLKAEQADPVAIVIRSSAGACMPFHASESLARTLVIFLVQDTAAVPPPVVCSGLHLYMREPLDPTELAAALHSAFSIRRLTSRLDREAAELERLRAFTRQGVQETVGLLRGLGELSLPGTGGRSDRRVRMALALAARFAIPEELLPDLELAARLVEIGRVVAAIRLSRADDHGSPPDAWHYVLASRELLRQVAGLQEAADLIGVVFENWDGSGHPGHRQQGQIPLRSRILRTVLDYQTALEAGGGRSPQEVISTLESHQGTRYDPMVLVHLRALIEGEAEGERREPRIHLQIRDLRAGMILADDLYSDAGIKLLASGTVLTADVLRTIHERDRFEPMLHGASVRPRPAPA
ncbi:MAG: HD domain-containing phosphohydrolase [Gemmatimonadales bacterium]